MECSGYFGSLPRIVSKHVMTVACGWFDTATNVLPFKRVPSLCQPIILATQPPGEPKKPASTSTPPTSAHQCTELQLCELLHSCQQCPLWTYTLHICLTHLWFSGGWRIWTFRQFNRNVNKGCLKLTSHVVIAIGIQLHCRPRKIGEFEEHS